MINNIVQYTNFQSSVTNSEAENKYNFLSFQQNS